MNYLPDLLHVVQPLSFIVLELRRRAAEPIELRWRCCKLTARLATRRAPLLTALHPGCLGHGLILRQRQCEAQCGPEQGQRLTARDIFALFADVQRRPADT